MNVLLGILLTAVAGALAGNCMLPLKFLRGWKWENAWFVFTLVSLIVLPWTLALTLVNGLSAAYAQVAPGDLALSAAFGFGWGIAQVLFGLSVARLGLALGYAVIIGLGALLGTLVPLFAQNRTASLDGSRTALIFGGVAIMLAGIAVSAWAGQRREAAGQRAGERRNYGSALAVAVLCGLLAPMLNYAFAFGQPIAGAAVAQGNSPAAAAYAVWPVGLAGGFIPNIAYAAYLLTRNRTWGLFGRTPGETWLAIGMGVFWMGAMAIYGVAAAYLGALGTSVGWALFQIFMIMTANASGMLTGEWRDAPVAVRRVFFAGFGLLALATVLMSLANRSGA